MKKFLTPFYYKEVPILTGDMDETLIVTYSPKYKAYQQKSGNGKSSVQRESSPLLVKSEREKIKMILCAL